MLSEKTDVAAWMADFFQSEFDRHFADRAA
jgi:hypothetical protein